MIGVQDGDKVVAHDEWISCEHAWGLVWTTKGTTLTFYIFQNHIVVSNFGVLFSKHIVDFF